MNQSMIHRGLACATGSAALLDGLFGVAYVPVAEAANIRIGVPLPQAGPASRWDTFSMRGATLAARQTNDAGGVVGMKFELIPSDGQCVPAEGVSATQRLLNITQVNVIFGPMCSSVAKALQPIIESAKIPMLLPATSDLEVTYKPRGHLQSRCQWLQVDISELPHRRDPHTRAARRNPAN